MEYNGCISSALENYLWEREFTNEINFMTNGVPLAGTQSKIIIMSSVVWNGKLIDEASSNK
jgi:hypothetical protein